MVTRAAKDLLRNTIRSTDYHNRLLEEEEMWRQWDLERGLTMMVTDDDLRKRMRMRMDQYPEPRKDSRSRLLAYSKQEARRELRHRGNNYWTQKLIEAEAKDPDKWGHSGYKELYPDEFKRRARRNVRSRSRSSRSSSSSSRNRRTRTRETRGTQRSGRKRSSESKHKKYKRKRSRSSDSETKRRDSRSRDRKGVNRRSSQEQQEDRCNSLRSRDRSRSRSYSHSPHSERSNGRYKSPHRSRSRSVTRSRKKVNGPSTPSDSRDSSAAISEHSRSGSRNTSPRQSLSPQPGSSSKTKHESSSRSRSCGSSSTVTSSVSSSPRSGSTSSSSSASSSSSSGSEVSVNKQILQQQADQLARFRRHFRSRSNEKETVWHNPTERFRLEDSERCSMFPDVESWQARYAEQFPVEPYNPVLNGTVQQVLSPAHWEPLQPPFPRNRGTGRSRNRRSLQARERRKRRRQQKKRRRRALNGIRNRANRGRLVSPRDHYAN